MIWLQLGLVAALAVGGWFAVHTYNSAIEERDAATVRAEKAESAARENAAAIAKLQEMGRLVNTLGIGAKKEAALERARADKFEKELQDAITRDATVRNWAIDPIPDYVRRMRRADAGIRDSGKLLGADRSTGTDSGASDAGRDERRAPAGDRGG